MAGEVAALVGSWAKRRYQPVAGAPVQPGTWVRIIGSTDETGNDDFIGKRGLVHYLEYDCGCGQVFPESPMIGVRLFCEGQTSEFWFEELEVLGPESRGTLPQ